MLTKWLKSRLYGKIEERIEYQEQVILGLNKTIEKLNQDIQSLATTVSILDNEYHPKTFQGGN